MHFYYKSSFFFITALRPTHHLLLCSLQKGLLQSLLTWTARNRVHRQKNSSLLASIPLSSVFLSLYHSWCTRAFWSKLSHKEDWQVCRRGGQIKSSLSPISSFWPVFPGTPDTATVLVKQRRNSFQLCPNKVRSFPWSQRGRRWDWMGGKKKKVKGRRLVCIYWLEK